MQRPKTRLSSRSSCRAFRPRRQLTDVSGRGVGMDIVRTNIERLNGQITVRSNPGRAREVIIQLPLTLATTKALMVVANETVYAIPLVSVTEALADTEADIHSVNGRRTLRLRQRLLPVVDLASALGDRRPRPLRPENFFVVAARHGDRQVAFIVDRPAGRTGRRREVARRPRREPQAALPAPPSLATGRSGSSSIRPAWSTDHTAVAAIGLTAALFRRIRVCRKNA